MNPSTSPMSPRAGGAPASGPAQSQSDPHHRAAPEAGAPGQPWDYLIVTASNDAQARAYQSQLQIRHRLGALPNVREVMVVADPEGKRVGSGGSTICCLLEVVNRELASAAQASRQSSTDSLPEVRDRRDAGSAVEDILRRLRVLIIHAGGDSRRLPAYGPCGKIFIPVPGPATEALGCALFDRLAPNFLSLPAGRPGEGQIVMAAGDALILFDPSHVTLAHPGLTALTCLDTPEHASKHGVFCAGQGSQVRLYLQKPGVEEQKRLGAINSDGRTLLDIGVMSFDATMALALLRAYGIAPQADGRLDWPAAVKREVLARGVDFYREICCALGSEVSARHHFQQAKSAGCSWGEAEMQQIFAALSGVPFYLETIPQARFLHFGTTKQLISSGVELRTHDDASVAADAPLSLDNQMLRDGELSGANAWVEGCRLAAPLHLTGGNVVIGVEVNELLTLPKNACLDVLSGASRSGKPVWFVRAYGIGDTFKDTVSKGGTFCGRPLLQWLAEVGTGAEDIWDASVPADQRSLWDARVFPAEAKADRHHKWLWLFDPVNATPEQKQAFLAADRYSAAEVAVLADQDDFFARRRQLRCGAGMAGGETR